MVGYFAGKTHSGSALDNDEAARWLGFRFGNRIRRHDRSGFGRKPADKLIAASRLKLFFSLTRQTGFVNLVAQFGEQVCKDESNL